MERMGPEAVLVQSRMSAWGLGLELTAGDLGEVDPRVQAAVRGPEADGDPRERSAVGALVLRAHAWLRGREAPVAEAPAGAPAALWAMPALASARPERRP
jgi:hypothetical protein